MATCIIYVPFIAFDPWLVNLNRQTLVESASLFRWRNVIRRDVFSTPATSATFISQVEIETPNYIYLVFSACVIYENVDNVFIEISYPEVFKENLISFNNE